MDLKQYNVFGAITIWPGKANVLAVAVRTNQRSIEKMTSKEIAPIDGLSQGAHQILYGANLRKGKKPEVAIFQIGSSKPEPDLFANTEIQNALNECLQRVQEAFDKP